MDRTLIQEILEVVEQAAIASAKLTGLGKKDEADAAAVEAMRNRMGKIQMQGRIVIGEGERDEAPMLYIGEKLGTGKGPRIDIAVDPLEGTNFAAKNLPGALSVMAISLKGNLFNAPETYMDKIAVGNDVPYDATDLDFSIEKNLKNIDNNIKYIRSVAPHANPNKLMLSFYENILNTNEDYF